MAETLLGYKVEAASPQFKHVAYYLHGPRTTYTLMRQVYKPEILFALNSRGHVCGVKGNYTFTDRRGYLEVAEVLS